MTGSEHYAKAEELIQRAEDKQLDTADQMVAAAHVHAILALAAAIPLAFRSQERAGEQPSTLATTFPTDLRHDDSATEPGKLGRPRKQ
jgi:hypothetical protein